VMLASVLGCLEYGEEFSLTFNANGAWLGRQR